jgi:hypothetical protein
MRTAKDCFSEENPLGFPVIQARWHDLASALKLPKAPEFPTMLKIAMDILQANGTSSTDKAEEDKTDKLSNEDRGAVLVYLSKRFEEKGVSTRESCIDYRNGFLTGGDNLHQTFVANLKEARAWCDARIKCVGFTFQGDKDMQTGVYAAKGRFEVWFKTSPAWHPADGWHSYLKGVDQSEDKVNRGALMTSTHDLSI